ncbi:MAG: ATP-binding protein [Bernardetiaceae bacterium]|nr:ATP-binding protein [Bernardetiaceae bacterium]
MRWLELIRRAALPTQLQQQAGRWLGGKPLDFKNFRFNIFFRVMVLTITVYGFTLLIGAAGYTVTSIGLGALIIYQTLSLIRQVENTNQEVINFLNSIKYDDFSNHYKLSLEGDTFKGLADSFNQVLDKFRTIRAEKEAHYQYLKTIVHHVGIGIVSFDAAGQVQIVNTAAKRLFKVGRLAHIDELNKFSPELVAKCRQLRTGARELVKVVHGAEIVQLAMYAIELTLQAKEYKLITFQNIHNELEEQEMDAWQKLIRVLTHEIMNSVTPISSLATTLEGEMEYLAQRSQQEAVGADDLEDMQMAIKTIQRRSDGLIRFVSDFRNLTHVPVPRFRPVIVKELFAHIRTLMLAEIEENDILFHCQVQPGSLVITADQEMIEQVLINIVKNAIQALADMTGDPQRAIVLLAGQDEKSRPYLLVRDNGPGIDPEALERIFIPFFTTKKNGSGIGLSLSRQIMRQHQGTLTATSALGQGTDFVLRF